jgi:hypothetical protein
MDQEFHLRHQKDTVRFVHLAPFNDPQPFQQRELKIQQLTRHGLDKWVFHSKGEESLPGIGFHEAHIGGGYVDGSITG